ncbi:MAG TPA: hypothetical protein VG077_02905, partial [Verrucomicrobiae bacterium]|nr:hypothetical protein [Verrucomicrobiae bacterium]
ACINMSTEQISLEEHKVKRNRAVILTIGVMLLLMVVEGLLVAGKTKYDDVRYYHGLCNDGVGQPYVDFIHQLRGLSDSGNTKELSRVLAAADTNSVIICDVWLSGDMDAYHASIQKILK